MIGINIQGMLSVTHAALPHLLRAAEDSPCRVADIISAITGRVAWNGLRPQDQQGRDGHNELSERAIAAARAGPSPYDDAVPFFRQALDLGITFWDTANSYNAGTSEEAGGRALKELIRRDTIVVATKVYFPVHDGPGGSGLSRQAIMEQIHASLTRLGTDYVDLYQIHRFEPRDPGRGDDGGAA